MKLYLNIENIRFSNQIDFKIIIEENLNIDPIKVPSLILQPFLENALWHGLSTKKNDKSIIINIYKLHPDYISISITDNGIGRVASEKINKEKSIKQKSVGITITKARLANFEKDYKNNCRIEIIDLYEDNLAKGTKVVLDIPVV